MVCLLPVRWTRWACAIANAALGNTGNCPVIEVSMGGLALECIEGSVTLAVAGGGFLVALDQISHGSWVVAALRAGSKLTVKPGPWGSWTYLAFAGQLQAKKWLGNISTHAPSGLGSGQLLAGQRLVIEEAKVREERTAEIACPVSARPRHPLKIVIGPQDRFFAPQTIETLLSQPFTLTDAYDRMGVRLAGPSLAQNTTLDMPSKAIVRGSIPVSGDGVPTVLLADHQTTGGYPKIATLVDGHLDGFAQLRSQSQAGFAQTSPEAAILAARTRHHSQAQFLAGIHR